MCAGRRFVVLEQVLLVDAMYPISLSWGWSIRRDVRTRYKPSSRCQSCAVFIDDSLKARAFEVIMNDYVQLVILV